MRDDSKKLNRSLTREIFASLVMFACLTFAGEFALAQEPVTVRNTDGSTTVTHPDGSTNTTDIPDTRYGSGGTREEEKDAKGRVVRSVWKDPRGRVLESVYTTYGEDGTEVIAKIYTRNEEGQVTGSSETTKRNDTNGNEIYSGTKTYDEKDKQTSATKTEVEPDGSKTTYRWDPNLGIYFPLPISGTPVTQPGLGTTATPDGGLTTRHSDGSSTVKHVDGNSTTKGIPDDRYGTGGTREEERDATSRVRERSWKDRRGTTLEDEFTYYGANGKDVVVTIYNPTPGGGLRRGRQTITKTDRDGKEISTETVIYKDGIETSRTKTEVDRKGMKRNYKWDPQKGYVELATNVTPQTARQGESSSERGFGVTSEVGGGLNTTIFATPRGKIRVNLPDDMAAGDTLSGTVIAEPQGKDDKERAANQGELSGYVVEIEKQQASSTSRSLKLAIPVASSSTYLVLKDKQRKEVARIEVPVFGQSPPVEEFDLPTMGQQGRTVQVGGRFDGDFSTTNLKVGGEDLEVLAESPRRIVARNTSNKIGPTELVVGEQGRAARCEFRSLGLKLSAPKLDLLRGEQTTLTVAVLGLEGIKESVPLVLENQSAAIISMGGGNLERITVGPSQVEGGTYTIERPLTGIQRGAFTITATVTGRGEGCNTSEAPTNSSDGTLKAAGTPGYTICGSGCQPPASEQGTGRIRCITTQACRGRGTGCACHMFRRPAKTTGDYEHVENPEVYADRDSGYDYVCRCVKK